MLGKSFIFLYLYNNNIIYLGSSVYAEGILNRYCSEINPNYDFSELENMLDSIENIEACTDLSVGDTRVTEGAPNRIFRSYSLRRAENNRYELAFNVNYVQTNMATTTPAQLYDRTNECLEGINNTERFRGPDGQLGDLKVMSATQASSVPEFQRPPEVDIAIMPDEHRSTSRAYEEDLTCDVIIHELLHRTGLADEYPERSMGTYLNPETGVTYNWDDDV